MSHSSRGSLSPYPLARWFYCAVLCLSLFHCNAQPTEIVATESAPIVVTRSPRNPIASVLQQLGVYDYMVQFTVSPANCSVSPDPSQGLSLAAYDSKDITPNYYSVSCPDPITEATIDFAVNRTDQKVVVLGNVLSDSAERNLTTITVTKSQTSDVQPYVRLSDLHLCNNMTEAAVCKDFQINVGFSRLYPPVISKLQVINGPITLPPPYFTSECEVYPVQLYQNVPVIFAVQADHQHRIFVDSSPVVKDSSKGFISSSQFLEYRPRVEPGQTENVTVYAATYDQAQSRNYTIMITTLESSEPRLSSLAVSPGRLEPQFSPNVFSYFARVPEGRKKFKVSLTGLDDVHTSCMVNQDNSTVIVGNGAATVYMPADSTPGSHTIVIDCTSQDQSDSARYTLALVPQRGGSTLLQDLDIVGGAFDRSFDPLNHGPYITNLELQQQHDQGWVAFVGHTLNSRATMTAEYIPFNKTSGMSPWFRVEKGEFRRFRVAVRTPENPVEEEYFIHVDRRGKWYESARYSRSLADWIGWTSVLSSAGSAPAFLQNMHLMQFLSVSNRINGKPETYDAWSEGFNKWNLQWNVPLLSKPSQQTEIINANASAVVVPPEPYSYIINAAEQELEDTTTTTSPTTIEMLKTEAATILSTLSTEFYTTTTEGKWVPAIDFTSSSMADVANNFVQAAVMETFASSENAAVARRRLSALSDEDKLHMIRDINATYKQHAAIRDSMSSIITVTVALVCVACIYATVAAISVNRSIKSKDGRVRDMPKILHPIRFWSFVFDIVLIAYSQAGFSILTCPAALKRSEFIILGFIHATPKAMLWFSGFVLLLFPLAYLGLVGWVLFSLKSSVVFSKDLSRYHKKDLFVAKAESRILPWLPIISNLLSVEIRDAFPIFRPGDEDLDDDVRERPPIEFKEDNRTGGPCNVDAPEFGLAANQVDPISSRNKTNDQHYAMLPHSQDHEERIRYHPQSDEMKVSLGGLRTSHASDSDNAPVYNKYPDAQVGRKCFKVKNPYGLELDCHALLQMKHLSNLWQMSELPHHFHFWIPRRNCQMIDFDGWNHFFDNSHRGNFFYYLIDRIALLSIVGIIVCWAETSGLITGLTIIGISLALSALYTPAAIATGTSKWYAQMEEELRLRDKEARFEEAEKERQNRWPFGDPEVKQRVDELQREREAVDSCGHGGWFARNRDCGFSQMSLWKKRSYFCMREWITGAPGFELMKCLIVAAVTLGNSSVGGLGNGSASTLAVIFACLGSIFLNYDSVVAIFRQCKTFNIALGRFARRSAIWIYEAATDSSHIGGRFSHLFKTLGLRFKGLRNGASFDFPGTIGERVRDYHVRDCSLIADEVGLQFTGPIKPSDMTSRLQERVGSRHADRYGLIKTLYTTGPLGAHRQNVDDSFPVRLPFRDFYLGKLAYTQGVAATIHVVNHGFRCQLLDQKEKNVFTSEDDSYLSLYRDPRFLPEWGVIRTKHQGHGYAIHYDHETHSLMIKGPSLREGVDYRVQSDTTFTSTADDGLNGQEERDVENYSLSAESVESAGGHCLSQAVCSTSGTLYVPVPHGKPPSMFDPIEIQSPEGDRFTLNPNDVKVHYDSISRELVLRHRLFLESDEQSVYRAAWTVAGLGVPINEQATCHESGILHVKLSRPGVPDLRSKVDLRDSDNVTFTADPRDTDAHRVALPTTKEPRGFGLVVSRMASKMLALGRQIKGSDALRDTVEASIPCTIVQCVNPNLGQYRVEPNFRDAMKTVRAQIHSLEAQRSQLDDVDRLATAWHSVMSRADFCDFWQQHGVNIVPTEALWINPLRDLHEPLVKGQFTKIEAAVPELRSKVQSLFAERVKDLESELHTLSQWVRAYDDVNLYGAQLQKDVAEMSGYTSQTGLESYVRKVKSFKQQYESQIPNFSYPFVVEERHITRMPNISAQLRQWQRQLAVWLRAEEDAPLMNVSLGGTPRSVSSTGSDRVGESASLERTVMEVMHALKDNINRLEDPTIGKYRSVLHYVTDSLNVRGPYTNWRPDPIGGHVALVRVWYPKSDGTPDFEREPVWNPCCVKLSANAIKILLPGKDDVDFRFSTPYYWSHVLGHSIQLDCLETLEVSQQNNLPVGHASNLMLKGMPGQLVCRLTSAPQLRHVGDQHIRLVENGAPGQEILMRRDGAPEDEDIGSSPRSSEGDAFLISLGKRMSSTEARHLPVDEVRVNNGEAQAFPLTFRFGERFIAKWSAAVNSAQMNKPPLEIDDQFGLPLTEGGSTTSDPAPPLSVQSEYSDEESVGSKLTIPSEVSSESLRPTPPPTPHEEQAVYEGDWQNYRYHGTGRLMDSQGNEVYNGEWKDGKRWGKGRCTFRDARGLLWQYEGQFKDDEFCGKGKVMLIDPNELNRLKSSTDLKDHQQFVEFIGEVRGAGRRTNRGYTAPLEADKPNLHPAILKQLFDQDPSYNEHEKPLIIDIRRTMSCAGDVSTLNAPLSDLLNAQQGSVSSVDSQASYQAAKDEYLPHRTRWARSLDPSLGFESLEGRLVVGTAHFADGSVYQGRFHNGRPHGKGRFMTADESMRCEGNWSKGVPHGFAVATEKKSNGTESSYFGTFVHGKRSGHGIQTAKNGLVYVEGQWSDDTIKNSEETMIHIQPEAVETPGSIIRFTGSVVDGLPEGEGKLTWTDNVTYRGNLSKGMRSGQGVMRDGDKRVLVSAPWKDDVPHGRVARLVSPDGKVYTGDVYEGKRQGMGELYHSEKGEPFFEGLWVNNMAHGRGTLYAKDGTYEGEFKEGKREGKGTFEYSENPAANGKQRLYIGDWKSDVPHGLGKYRNELGVDNTYKFNKGQLDKSSLNAYKNGMCGKVPLIGVAPTVSPSGIGHAKSTSYGSERPVTPSAFKQLWGDYVQEPLWSRTVANKPMKYVDPSKAPQQAIRPASHPPSRPVSEDGSKTPPFQTESPVRQRLLKVEVLRGKDLPLLDGKTKPFVKVIIGKEMKKTKIVSSGNSTPQWNASLNFPLRREQKILLEVLDQDLQYKDRFMASGETDLMSFLNTNKQQSDVIEVPVVRPNPATGRDDPAGSIFLRYSIAERPALVESSDEGSAHEPSNNGVRKPYVHIRITEGRDLTNMDTMKKMDPYVKVILGSTTKQTTVAKKAGVNPKWNNEEFYLPYDGEQRLALEVFDKDTLTADDFIGRAEINLPITSFSGSVKLYRADKKKGSTEAGLLEIFVNTVEA